MVQVPLAAALVATAGCILVRQGRWGKAAVCASSALYAACALFWQASMLRGLDRTGGVGPWPDGVYELTERLAKRFPGREVTVLDWGLTEQHLRSSDGAVRTRDPGPTTGFLRALAAGRPVLRRHRMFQRSGAAYAEIVEIEPHTLRGPQPDVASLAVPTRVTAGDPRFSSRLGGVHEIEHGAWRWTGRSFPVVLEQPETAEETVPLLLSVNLPPPSWDKLGPVTLSAQLGSRVPPAGKLHRPGDHMLCCDLQAAWLLAPNRFEFQLDKAVPPGGATGGN